MELEERLIHLLSAPDEDEPAHITHLDKSRPMWEQYANVYNIESLPPPSKSPTSSPTKARPSPSILIPQKKPTSSSSLSGSTASSSYISSQSPYSTDSSNELAVHISTDWKKAFQLGSSSKSPKSAHTGEIEGWWEDPDDPVHILNACASTMQELWLDHQVRKCLNEKRLRLEESSGL